MMRYISTPTFFNNILFIDIETVACTAQYQDLEESFRLLWNKKAATLGTTDPQGVRELFFDKAAIYAEFGKIISIGLGHIMFDNNTPMLHVQGLSNHDEKVLLQTFRKILMENSRQNSLRLCAHNGKEFDFPYLCRRMLVHGIPLPPVLDTAGKKPWEVSHLDTMEMWKFGDRKSFTSLDLLAALFNIKSSKVLMDGSEVNRCYYVDNDLDKVTTYCQHDVAVMVQVFLKLNCWECIQPQNIIFT